MRRKTKYDMSKLTQVANNKSVVSVYVDAFPIEQVKFKFAEFENASNSIDIYLSFEEVLRLTQDCKSGKLFKDATSNQYGLQIAFGGSIKNGTPESRVLGLKMSGDKVYLNAQKGKGKQNSTGAILPDGSPDVKVSVGMTIDTFKGMMLYTESAINAYLVPFINYMVKIAEENRNMSC